MSNIESKNFLSKYPIQSVKFRNYRALRNTKILIKPLTFIIGKNGSGKSTILDGLKTYFRHNFNPKTDIFAKIEGDNGRWASVQISLKGSRFTFNWEPKNLNKIGIVLVSPIITTSYSEKGDRLLSVTAKEYWRPRKTGTGEADHEQLYSIFKERIQLFFEDVKSDLIAALRENTKPLAKMKHKRSEINTWFNSIEADYQYNSSSSSGRNIDSGNTIVDIWQTRTINVPDYKFNPVEIMFSMKSLLPPIFFIESSTFQINSEQTEIALTRAKLPRDLRTDADLFSLFHYGTNFDVSEEVHQIIQWAEKFGFGNLRQIPEKDAKLALRFIDKSTRAPIDVFFGGSGVRSVLYLIGQCVLANSGDVLVIDEPELHLHSTSQAILLDLFIETMNRGIQIIIATHSDYLIQRLQRRISENVIEPSQIGIVEMSNEASGAHAKNLGLNPDGTYHQEIPEVVKFALEEYRHMMGAGGKNK